MKNMTQEQLKVYMALVRRLEAWPEESKAVLAKRDALIHEARGLSMTKTEIAERMGISRTTVISVLGDESED
jgi:transcriptional regulator with XRE-family HTH domain